MNSVKLAIIAAGAALDTSTSSAQLAERKSMQMGSKNIAEVAVGAGFTPLDAMLEDPVQLAPILKYHVVSAKVTAADVIHVIETVVPACSLNSRGPSHRCARSPRFS